MKALIARKIEQARERSAKLKRRRRRQPWDLCRCGSCPYCHYLSYMDAYRERQRAAAYSKRRASLPIDILGECPHWRAEWASILHRLGYHRRQPIAA